MFFVLAPSIESLEAADNQFLFAMNLAPTCLGVMFGVDNWESIKRRCEGLHFAAVCC